MKYIVLAIILFLSALSFQNCSGSLKFAPSETEFVADGATVVAERVESISPTYDKVENVQPIKVLLIVDDSETMANSQDNLSKNMNHLLESIKMMDSEVMILSTTCGGCTVNVTQSPDPAAPNTTVSYLRRKFNPAVPKFTFNRNQSENQRESVVTQISNYLKQMGIAGSSSEMPLRSLAFALENDQFFKKDDNALVYIITDEDENNSSIYQLRSFVKLEHTIKSKVETSTTTSTHAGYAFSWNDYISRWFELSEVPIYNDRGEQIGTQLQRNEYSNFHTSYSECQADAVANRGTCDTAPKNDEAILPSNQTVSQACNAIRTTYTGRFLGCTAKTITLTQTIRTGGDTLFSAKELFLNVDQFNYNLQQAVKAKMDSLFGARYLIAASVNLANQDCTLSPGQTIDTTIKKFSSVLQENQFVMSSICDQSSLSGQGLKDIATRFGKLLKNNYQLVLKENERIKSVTITQNGQSKLLQPNEFVFNNNVLVLTAVNSDIEIEGIQVVIQDHALVK